MTSPLLDRARAGDHDAFAELVDPYRRELQLHCYRLLGRLADAEDAVQETLLAAWRGLPEFEGRASVRSWLYRIATRRCLNAVRDAGRRPPLAPTPPFEAPEPTRHNEVPWVQPYPDVLLPEPAYLHRERVELAFVEALATLPPRQTAALVVCDVLGFPLTEAAAVLDTTAAAVKGALQRARSTLRSTATATAPATAPAASRPPAHGSAEERRLGKQFATAFVADDVDAVIALLTDDAWLAMPPAPHQYAGPAAIAGFLRASAAWRAGRRYSLLPTRANAQPGFGCYLGGAPAGLVVLTLDGDRIARITRFMDDSLFPAFGLPRTFSRSPASAAPSAQEQDPDAAPGRW
ncbi:sigma-70 family RNA polymerase sigma factor [Jiangella ureilytica]|uniref:Sigma-70 family RNA polymerase sigma factor n=1 Tax=Jiangella ureilytica TaxID=2530374 RepID=A0A4R4REB3_9ACTN|nr:RNA polymerase subunit sigma-70 [Jiangella ureilytica]TDC47671.1 sigma-70 family RNA polymerase sigma factor [Jiangella ureilytica]